MSNLPPNVGIVSGARSSSRSVCHRSLAANIDVTDDSGQRMCTEEALLYELDAEGKIARVAVYTQKSEQLPG